MLVTYPCDRHWQHRRMPPDSDGSVRLVIQCVYLNRSRLPNYILAFYPGPKNSPCHSERFFSWQDLTQRLTAAIPGFDERLLTEPRGYAEIIFAQTMKLSDAQRETLASQGIDPL